MKLKVGIWAAVEIRCGDDDNGCVGRVRLHSVDQISTYNVLDAAVEDYATNGRKAAEEIQCFASAVGSKDVELGGFDHKFASGNATRKFAVDNEKTRSVHLSVRCNFAGQAGNVMGYS